MTLRLYPAYSNLPGPTLSGVDGSGTDDGLPSGRPDITLVLSLIEPEAYHRLQGEQGYDEQ